MFFVRIKYVFVHVFRCGKECFCAQINFRGKFVFHYDNGCFCAQINSGEIFFC